MVKIQKQNILARKLPQEGRICYNMMRQDYSASPMLTANLDLDRDKYYDPYNKKIWQIYHCRRRISCDSGRMHEHRRGQLTFLTTCRKRVCTGCARCKGVLQRHAYVPSIVKLEKQANAEKQAKKVGGEAGFYFVTLTQPTVFYDQLREQIDLINKEWRKLYKLTKKKSCKFYLSGLRSIEIELSEIKPKMLEDRVTGYRKALKSWKVKNSESLRQLLDRKIAKIEEVQGYVFKLKDELRRVVKENNIFDFDECKKDMRKYWQNNAYKLYTYHPHMHLIVQGKRNALWLKKQWLKRFPDALQEAQDVVKVGHKKYDRNAKQRDKEAEDLGIESVGQSDAERIAKAIYEITKYVTKTMGPIQQIKKRQYARALYWLHSVHLHARKTFAAFGKVVKATPKEIETFFDEQKEAGNYDYMDDDDELTTEELERIVKRSAYVVDDDRKDLHDEIVEYDREKKNYLGRRKLDESTGEEGRVQLAKKGQWDPPNDLTERGRFFYLKEHEDE